jgi:hypothetical protein
MKKIEAKQQSLLRVWAFVADGIFDRSEGLSPPASENGTGRPASYCTEIASSNHNMAAALNKFIAVKCQSDFRSLCRLRNLSSPSVA